MTLSGASSQDSTADWVVLAAGAPAAVAALQAEACPALAAALARPLAAPLDPLHPDRALAALAASPGGRSSLVPLPRDPGHGLSDGRHWAEALGAWRQPTLVLLDAGQVESGLPASISALLGQWQVPCVGLVQWGGAWDGCGRRRDGLLWLGALGAVAADGGAEAAAALRTAVRARWAALQERLGGMDPGVRVF
jgi:hypothetical protein